MQMMTYMWSAPLLFYYAVTLTGSQVLALNRPEYLTEAYQISYASSQL